MARSLLASSQRGLLAADLHCAPSASFAMAGRTRGRESLRIPCGSGPVL